jgi:acyl-CoA thioester hydrolase
MDAPFETDVAVRYRDLDTYGHVNNAVYLTYCETARSRLVREVFDVAFDELDHGFVVAHFEVDFRRPVRDAEAVSVGIAVTRVGTTSFATSYDLRVDGERVASAESVQVVVDPDTREPVPVPDHWREALDRFVPAGADADAADD